MATVSYVKNDLNGAIYLATPALLALAHISPCPAPRGIVGVDGQPVKRQKMKAAPVVETPTAAPESNPFGDLGEDDSGEEAPLLL